VILPAWTKPIGVEIRLHGKDKFPTVKTPKELREAFPLDHPVTFRAGPNNYDDVIEATHVIDSDHFIYCGQRKIHRTAAEIARWFPDKKVIDGWLQLLLTTEDQVRLTPGQFLSAETVVERGEATIEHAEPKETEELTEPEKETIAEETIAQYGIVGAVLLIDGRIKQEYSGREDPRVRIREYMDRMLHEGFEAALCYTATYDVSRELDRLYKNVLLWASIPKPSTGNPTEYLNPDLVDYAYAKRTLQLIARKAGAKVILDTLNR